MTDGREVCRDATHFKYVGRRRKSIEVRKENQGVRRSGDWRGDALRKATTGTTNVRGQDSNRDVAEANSDHEPEPELRTVPRRSERVPKPDRYGDFYYY